MLLETSRRYNPALESITFLKDFSYNKEDFAKAGIKTLPDVYRIVIYVIERCYFFTVLSLKIMCNIWCLSSHFCVCSFWLFFAGLQFEFINPIFEFSKGMNDLHLDEAEYALLIAINIFSAGQFDPQQLFYIVCLLLVVFLYLYMSLLFPFMGFCDATTILVKEYWKCSLLN